MTRSSRSFGWKLELTSLRRRKGAAGVAATLVVLAAASAQRDTNRLSRELPLILSLIPALMAGWGAGWALVGWGSRRRRDFAYVATRGGGRWMLFRGRLYQGLLLTGLFVAVAAAGMGTRFEHNVVRVGGAARSMLLSAGYVPLEPDVAGASSRHGVESELAVPGFWALPLLLRTLSFLWAVLCALWLTEEPSGARARWLRPSALLWLAPPVSAMALLLALAGDSPFVLAQVWVWAYFHVAAITACFGGLVLFSTAMAARSWARAEL